MYDSSCTLASPMSVCTSGGLLSTYVFYPWESLAHREGEAWDSTAQHMGSLIQQKGRLSTGAMKPQQGRL